MNYHNKKFTPIETSENSETSNKTIFHYKQIGDILSCTYSDSNIIIGNIIGKVDSLGNIDMRYHQINSKGEINTGVCKSSPELLENGKIKLLEQWQWTSGDFSKGNSILVEL